MKTATFTFAALACTVLQVRAQTAAPRLEPITTGHQMWVRSEFRLQNVVSDKSNVYDPEQIALDATIEAPSKKKISLPLFWYQNFRRTLETKDGKEREVLTAQTGGEWRLRWMPLEIGLHRIVVSIKRRNLPMQTLASTCRVGAKPNTARGMIRIEPIKQNYFQTADGVPLPLLGENVCWNGERGSYDYDDWFGALGRNRMNFARLWLMHNSFSPETWASERQNYSQSRLWRLDYTVDLAQNLGINLLFCLDYHGIFQTEPDMWGGNDLWPKHAYQIANGGPCEKPNDFFTNDQAQKLYRARLRYLVARFGANSNLLGWQFFNEINNVYGPENATRETNRNNNRLHPPDVVNWHQSTGQYLRSLDVYKHPITTSFGSAGEQAAMWKLPQMEFANWHWYANWGGPFDAVTRMTDEVSRRLPRDYGKPVLISEFGTDGRGWRPENDVHRRGLRQAVWGGIFGGSAGTSMPWWWEDIHANNAYAPWKALREFLPTDFGSAKWRVVHGFRPESRPVLGTVAPNGKPFSERIGLLDTWGVQNDGQIVLNAPGDGSRRVLGGFVHGSSKPEMRNPWKISAHLGANATLILHLNSVSNEAKIRVRQNGIERFARDLPNKDGGFERNNEYNEDISVPLEAGRSLIEIDNPGGDWFYLDWAQLEGVLPAQSAEQTGLETRVLGDGNQALLWLVDERFSWPRGQSAPDEVVKNAVATIPNWPSGNWQAQWWHTTNGKVLGTTRARTQNGVLKLPVMEFAGDVAARLTRVR